MCRSGRQFSLPILLGVLLGFWGVLLAAPLLAVIYAYRAARSATTGMILVCASLSRSQEAALWFCLTEEQSDRNRQALMELPARPRFGGDIEIPGQKQATRPPPVNAPSDVVNVRPKNR